MFGVRLQREHEGCSDWLLLFMMEKWYYESLNNAMAPDYPHYSELGEKYYSTLVKN
jgi:hypothetical protein